MNIKKISVLVLAFTIIALFSLALLTSTVPSDVNYSPNTGDTPWEFILFIGLGIVAVLLLVFVVIRRRK